MAPQKPEPPPAVTNQAGELAEPDFQQWRRHPATKWFFRYLADYRADLLSAAQDQWLAGEAGFAVDGPEMRGRALCLGEMADLKFPDIQAFYQQLDQLEHQANEAKAAEHEGGPV